MSSTKDSKIERSTISVGRSAGIESGRLS